MFGKQFGGNDHTEIARSVMGRIQNGPHHLRSRRHVSFLPQGEINAVDFISHIAVTVFHSKNCGIQRNIDDVVDVLSRYSRHFRLRAELRASHSNYAKPLFVDLDVLVDRIRSSEQARLGSGSQHTDWRTTILVALIEKPAFQHLKSCDLRVNGVDSVNRRRILLRFWNGS